MKARKMLALVLALVIAIGMMPAVAFAAPAYSDTDGHWAESHIERWTAKGVVNGISDTEFDPEGNMTRAQAASVFAKLLKKRQTYQSTMI